MRVILVAGALAMLVAACASGDKSGRFSIALGNKLQSGQLAEVDLASIDAPDWDELFIFNPHSTRDDNCKVIKLDWLECRTTLPASVAEGENFLVFLTKGRISGAQRHSQSNGDFPPTDPHRPQPIKRSAAKFTVIPAANTAPQGKPRFRLEYKD